jgi:GTP1/Obg family GTP-binding protein
MEYGTVLVETFNLIQSQNPLIGVTATALFNFERVQTVPTAENVIDAFKCDTTIKKPKDDKNSTPQSAYASKIRECQKYLRTTLSQVVSDFPVLSVRI